MIINIVKMQNNSGFSCVKLVEENDGSYIIKYSIKYRIRIQFSYLKIHTTLFSNTVNLIQNSFVQTKDNGKLLMHFNLHRIYHSLTIFS